MCVEANEAHFFGIGDWGGYCNWVDNVCKPGEVVKPMEQQTKRAWLDNVDDGAQQRVAKQMSVQAQKTAPEFVITVGDHFYPGGIDTHCGGDQTATVQYQWKTMYEDIYDNDTLGVEWMGVLGNHDYGGTCYTKGWDQQVYYTWVSNRWLLPAQYWMRKVHFKDFIAEFYFLDTNIVDAKPPGDDPDHNICSEMHNAGGSDSYCPAARFPAPAGSEQAQCTNDKMFESTMACAAGFKALWLEQKAWLSDLLSKSTAQWQIVVTHYPPEFPYVQADEDANLWPTLGDEFGIDLMITGHTHSQGLYLDKKVGTMAMFPYVVTGGGGGIISESTPSADGEDDMYGFVDFSISKDSMDISMISHTGLVRNKQTIKPRSAGGAGTTPSMASTTGGSSTGSGAPGSSTTSGAPTTSCSGRCGDAYDPTAVCHCNSSCEQFGNCCADFNDQCGSTFALV